MLNICHINYRIQYAFRVCVLVKCVRVHDISPWCVVDVTSPSLSVCVCVCVSCARLPININITISNWETKFVSGYIIRFRQHDESLERKPFFFFSFFLSSSSHFSAPRSATPSTTCVIFFLQFLLDGTGCGCRFAGRATALTTTTKILYSYCPNGGYKKKCIRRSRRRRNMDTRVETYTAHTRLCRREMRTDIHTCIYHTYLCITYDGGRVVMTTHKYIYCTHSHRP